MTSHGYSEAGWHFGLPSLLSHSAQPGRQNCQLCAPAALCAQGSFLVLVSVKVKGLGHMKLSKDPTGNRTPFLVMRSWPTLAFPACAWTDFGETQRPLCRILKSNWVPPKQKAEPPSFDPICSVASKRERKMKKLENKKVGIQAV